MGEGGADRAARRRARSSGPSSASARGTPRGSRARRRSRRWRRRRRCAPKRSIAASASASTLSQLGHVAGLRQRASSAAELRGQLVERLLAPRRRARARWPCRGSRRAVAAPMPLLAPVIRSTGSSAIGGIHSSEGAAWPHNRRPAIIAARWIPIASERSVSSSRSRRRRAAGRRARSTRRSAPRPRRSEPSEVLAAGPGETLPADRQGRRRLGAAHGRRARVRDRRPRTAATSAPVTYTGIVPDPFREGREVIVTGELDESGTFVAEKDSLITKCPSKFADEAEQDPEQRRSSRSDRARASVSAPRCLVRPARRRSTPSVAALIGTRGDRRWVDLRRGARSTRSCALLTLAVVVARGGVPAHRLLAVGWSPTTPRRRRRRSTS